MLVDNKYVSNSLREYFKDLYTDNNIKKESVLTYLEEENPFEKDIKELSIIRPEFDAALTSPTGTWKKPLCGVPEATTDLTVYWPILPHPGSCSCLTLIIWTPHLDKPQKGPYQGHLWR